MAFNKSKEHAKLTRSMSSNEVFTRADAFDLKNLDIQLEKKLSKVLIEEIGASFPSSKCKSEEWEIDVSKLDIRYVIAKGTYGTVFRGTYDGKDIAGNQLLLSLWKIVALVRCIWSKRVLYTCCPYQLLNRMVSYYPYQTCKGDLKCTMHTCY